MVIVNSISTLLNVADGYKSSQERFMYISVGYLLMMDSVSTEGLHGVAVNKKQAARSIRRASFTTLTTRLSSL